MKIFAQQDTIALSPIQLKTVKIVNLYYAYFTTIKKCKQGLGAVK